MRAFSLGQPSRGATRRSSSRPKLAMARATMPMLSASCGRTRIRAGAVAGCRRRRAALAGAADAVAQLAQHAPGPEPVLLAGPGLGQLLQALGRAASRVPRPRRRTAESAKAISAWRATKSSKVLMPQLLHAQPAAGTGGIVRLAAPLGAIGRGSAPASRGRGPATASSAKPDIDGLLVARVHDRRHRQPAPATTVVHP